MTSSFLQDLRYTLRQLRRSPGFAATAILSLALGIGTTTAMFTLIYAVVLDAYPYADHQRTVNPIVRDPEHPSAWDWFVLTPAQAAAYRQVPAFEDILGLGNGTLELRGQELPEDLHAVYLTPNDATFNRVPALLGRGIQPSDDGKHNVVVLSYKFWLRRFHGERSIVGQSLQLENRDYTVVGVMPQRFTLGQPDIYLPSTLNTEPNARMAYFAKLKPGVTAEQASVAADPLVHEFAKQDPLFYPKKFHTQLQYLIEPVTKGTGGSPGLAHTFPLIALAVGMLLLIGCANCSILLLARGLARTHEFAMRSALGASRGRIIRQMLIESLVISLAGAASGIALAYFLADLPLKLLPTVFPSEALIRVTPSVLGFCAAVAVFAGVLAGLLPSLRFSRPEIAQAVQSSARTTTGGRSARRTLNTLIGGQIALTLALLAVAAAAAGGFMKLLHVPLGYDPTDTVMMGGPFTRGSLPSWPQRYAYLDQLKQAIAATPGVLAVADGDAPPDTGWRTDINLVGRPSSEQRKAHLTLADPSWFSTLRIPLLRGRFWNSAENRAGLPLAVVNQAFAKQYFGSDDPLDKRVEVPILRTITQRVPAGFDPPVLTPALGDASFLIVGVVADSINDGLEKPVAPGIYVPDSTIVFNGWTLLVHTQGNPAAFLKPIRDSIHAFNPNQKLFGDPWTLERTIRETPIYGQQRLISVLFGIFAGAALALALIGLSSVVAFAVAQRTSEFGVRMALGAERRSIFVLVFRSILPTLLGGSAAGLVLCAFLRQASFRWSEGSSQNPLFMAAAALLLICTGLLASLPPARRAAATEPMQALRAE